ncbi:hypothetical protein VTJ49DRAFT_5868 [Mycothermus thermophilus]|uniref:Uncharacterized protein n=1 Tax=Humicola insolens TaxID=85995 RepID=A0ABR3VKA0_HUMIN
MLFPEEHAPHLKQWIVKRLENTSDADPDVLADYVLALLRHDGSIADVRRLCEEEIPDFVKEDSPVFINDVFDAIAYQSYLPGAPPPPPKHARAPPVANATAAANVTTATAAAPQPLTSLSYDDTPMAGAPASAAPAYSPPRYFSEGSRKRAYVDWDDPAAQNGRDWANGSRPFKQRRGGGRGGGGLMPPTVPPNPGAFGSAFHQQQAGPAPQQPPLPGPTAVGYFDPKNPMSAAALYGMSLAAGHPMSELLAQAASMPPTKRKKCRDWERKGYCPRGTSCMFQHSNDPVFPPPVPGPPRFGGAQQLPQQSMLEEYDPTNALMPDFFQGPGAMQNHQFLPKFPQSSKPRGGKPRRGDKAPFSADGPVLDKSKSTIVVENIPEENLTEEQVRNFFSQFGTILEVTMKPYKRLAIIKYDSWDAATAAYQSPKVIFDNRFVKVFWYKDDVASSSALQRAKGPGGVKGQGANGASASGGNGVAPQPDIDIEEFAKQQQEKQKAFEEKQRKMQEIERQREELERRQKELLAKQAEEKAKLEAKLAAANGTKSANGDSDSQKKPMTQTEALRAQLAALEAEARQMGLDPDALDEGPSPSWSARGSPYGRGRGGWRGALSSPYAPRGRGSYRGRANIHAAYAAYSLDNRPKKVLLTGADFTVPERDEMLRQYLFGIGEFTDIQTTPTSAEITFKDRKTAEKFFNAVALNDKQIPGLDGTPLELAWVGPNGVVPGPSSSGKFPTTTPVTFGTTSTARNGTAGDNTNANGTAKGGEGSKTTMTTTTTADGDDHRDGEEEDDHDDAASGIASSDKDLHIQLERRPDQDQNEMDYEVADEEGWGY